MTAKKQTRKKAKRDGATVAEAGALGGKARAKTMTKGQRSEAARNAARARWAATPPAERSAAASAAANARWDRQKL
jgi:hypothetical protein